MHHRPSKKQVVKRLIVVYSAMSLAVAITVTAIVLFVLGFRFDSSNGSLEQYAFFQFSSTPSGAAVSINDKLVSSKTPSAVSRPAGTYNIQLWKQGYEKWTKNTIAKAGVITWLDYALLVPTELKVESVQSYSTVAQTASSADSRSLLVLTDATVPTFSLIDISSDAVKTTSLTIPKSVYSDAFNSGVIHSFKINSWDKSDRYVIVNHSYGQSSEWLLLDTQDVSLSANISKVFKTSFSDISFYGSGGSLFYAIENGNIRKIDLVAGTMSRSLVSGVESFSVFDSKTLAYVSLVNAGGGREVGVYQDGDENFYVIRTLSSNDSVKVATARYMNQDYLAIGSGLTAEIIGGVYPSSVSDVNTSMQSIATIKTNSTISNLNFSPTGEYVLIQSGAEYSSYDLEYKTSSQSALDDAPATTVIKWLNDNYLWSDVAGSLQIMEFDGQNKHKINSVSIGLDAVLSRNGRYLYSFDKTSSGSQLQRVRMILP